MGSANILRKLPAIDRLLLDDRVERLIERHSRPMLVSALRRTLGEMRAAISQKPLEWEEKSYIEMENEIFHRAAMLMKPDLRRVVNATGVIIHTNLGRAPLAGEAIEAMREASEGHSNLEYDLHRGARGSRQSLIEDKVCELTGGEAALVVNNNAGAVLLTLMALASGREAIISRGELVEIGGSFRIPDVMAASGAIMVEVGATNKTHFKDYRSAVTENTALLLKVHRSNFFIGGFTHETPVEELAGLAEERGLILAVDLGSGALIDTARFGLPHETTPGETLKSGAHLVTFSGDKLLGGPQAGIIAGKKGVVERLTSHPVHRALRPDKFTLAALEATLRLYIQGREERIPVISMLAVSPKELEKRAKTLKKNLEKRFREKQLDFSVEIINSFARVGGGALADAEMESRAVAISHAEKGPEQIIQALRRASPPVIARIERDKALLDMRSLWATEHDTLADVLAASLAEDMEN